MKKIISSLLLCVTSFQNCSEQSPKISYKQALQKNLQPNSVIIDLSLNAQSQEEIIHQGLKTLQHINHRNSPDALHNIGSDSQAAQRWNIVGKGVTSPQQAYDFLTKTTEHETALTSQVQSHVVKILLPYIQKCLHKLYHDTTINAATKHKICNIIAENLMTQEDAERYLFAIQKENLMLQPKTMNLIRILARPLRLNAENLAKTPQERSTIPQPDQNYCLIDTVRSICENNKTFK